MRTNIPLNYAWEYRPDFPEGGVSQLSENGWEIVDLPHTNKILPYNYLDEKTYQFVSCYRKTLFVPEAWIGNCVYLCFEGVMATAKIYCNGIPISEHLGGYTAFQVDLTAYLCWGSDNIIVVENDATERKDIPPCGGVVDYLTYGGIYREVSVLVVPKFHLSNIRIGTSCLTGEHPINVWADFSCATKGQVSLNTRLTNAENKSVYTNTIQIPEEVLSFQFSVSPTQPLTPWSLESPYLYSFCVELIQDGLVLDQIKVPYGHRTCCFTPDGFYLNGKPLKLIGLNRHQSYPYVGNAMPASVQAQDADILKYCLGVNLVRTSHYPQSKHFLDRCDEIGLLVFEEIPGWQHIGNGAWKEISTKNVEEMILHDFNHPSIILWGVRINESPDDHEFYTHTNEIAHQLDPTRQTGGVRCIQNSELLEDVYTFNDFVHSGGTEILRQRSQVVGKKQPVPLLVTENNGHMFPTKRFDQEARLIEHTKRHLRVINEAMGRLDITGSIGWCAFDYNTHGCFGSGDKICYHGVCDMFRIPKYAGLAYGTQRSAAEEPRLEILSVVSRGENDAGGVIPIHIATNCDFVRVYKNEELLGDYYPDTKTYPNLPHPLVTIRHLMPNVLELPICNSDVQKLKVLVSEKAENGSLSILSDEEQIFIQKIAKRNNVDPKSLMTLLMRTVSGWGDKENDFIFEGWYNGDVVITKRAGETKSFSHIMLIPDTTILHAHGDTYDAVRVVVKAVDTYGNLMPFYQDCMTIRTDEKLSVMGPNHIPLHGGCTAFWLRTHEKTGKTQVAVSASDGEHLLSIKLLP